MARVFRLIALLIALMQGGLFYPTTLTVTAVEQGVVTLEDHRGHAYTLPEDEAWKVGDKASCIMNSKGTYDRADDEIITAEFVWE